MSKSDSSETTTPRPGETLRLRPLLTGRKVLIAVALALGLWLLSDYIFDFGLGSRANRTAKYPILDSKTLAQTGSHNIAPQFYWVNNDELLFVAMQMTPDEAVPNKERFTFTVSRWDTRTGAVTPVQSFGSKPPRLCLFDGYVLIQVGNDENSYHFYHGPLGGELAFEKGNYIEHVCRPVSQLSALPEWTKGRDVRRLESLDGGFIDFGERQKSSEDTPLRFYRHGARQEDGIELPLYRGGVLHSFPYYPFKDAFFVVSSYYRHPRPKDVPYPVYWLYRDGRVEKIADVPWGPWRSRASFTVVPTKTGLLMASTNFRTETDLDYAGLYLFTEGKVQRIVKGWIEGLALMVSPDGCKAAFTYASTVTQKRNFLQAVNLCSGGTT